MAFWNRKSEDPWDIDPERRRKGPAVIFEESSDPEEDPPAEGESEKEGFLSGLFSGKKAEEEEPPVPCPYCGAEMEKGYLICGRGAIQWTKVKPGAVLGNLFAEAVTISDEGFLNSYKTSHMCTACRKIVVDVPEEKEEWSAPVEPMDSAEAYERYKEQLKHYQ